ncbi:MAG TPA: hypothetical protein VEC43_03290 [Candidatus Acidoferrales bacterium]|nr:hypothetical protein [Candidatus Acidoferrales bacterium]
MQIRRATMLLLVVLLTFFIHVEMQPAAAIGVANVVVTNVYWGATAASPDTAHPGDVNLQLSILITNVGDDVARNVTATLYIGPPIIYSYYVNGVKYSATSVLQQAGDIQAGQGYVLTYTLSIDPKAQEGIYRYSLELSYQSARELQQIDTTVPVNVPIWKGELHVQGVVTNPTKIYPNSKAAVVQVTIANSGQGTAKNIQLQLVLQPPFSPSSSGSDEIFVGNIPAGQTTTANFIVDVAENATFGQYSVILGEVTGNQLIPIGEVPLYVNEKVRFDIISATPSTVNVGDSGDVISVVIRNAGSVEADSVRVELLVGNFFTGTLTDFLGTMLANETKVAFFTVDVDSKAQPGQYTYSLRFDWTQDTVQLYDDYSYSITFTVQPPSVPVALIVVVLIVVFGGGGFLYMRRRKAKAAAQNAQPGKK